jgi:hypothetical protein
MLARDKGATISVDRAREICREIAASKGAAFYGLQKHPEPLTWTVIFRPDEHPVDRTFTTAGVDEAAFRRSVMATVFDDHS